MTIIKLPRVQKYTVDFRLKQFRKIELGIYEFISFDSERGRDLLKEIKKNGLSKFGRKLK